MALHKFLCGQCHQEVSVPREAIGQRGKCCKCGEVVLIPSPEKDRAFRQRLEAEQRANLDEKRRQDEAKQREEEKERRIEAERKRKREEQRKQERDQQRAKQNACKGCGEPMSLLNRDLLGSGLCQECVRKRQDAAIERIRLLQERKTEEKRRANEEFSQTDVPRRYVASDAGSVPATQECPYCAEIILAKATKCKHCGEFLFGAPRSTQSQSVPPNEQSRTIPSSGAGKTSEVTDKNCFIGCLVVLIVLLVMGSCVWINAGSGSRSETSPTHYFNSEEDKAKFRRDNNLPPTPYDVEQERRNLKEAEQKIKESER